MISVLIPSLNNLDAFKNNFSTTLTTLKEVGIDQITIVDDDSDDGVVEYLKTHFPDVTIIRNTSTRWLIRTLNKGVDSADSEWVLILMPHHKVTQIKLDELKKKLTKKVFSIGFSRQGESIQAGWVTSTRKESSYLSHDVPWIVSKKKWLTLEGLDPLFDPFFMAEADLCCRAELAGYTNLRSHSLSYASDRKSDYFSFFPDTLKQRLLMRNQVLFFWKNNTKVLGWILHLGLLVLGCLTFRIKRTGAFFSALASLHKIVAYRKKKPIPL